MPKRITGDDYSEPDTEQEYLDQINSPDIGDNGEAKNRAITSARQAKAIADRIIETNRHRNRLDAKIVSRFNGEDPFPREELKRTGQAWRNNFSTKPMASPVDRTSTELTDYIGSAPTLTNSSLPDHYHNAKEKTDSFRAKTTALIRSWRGWNDFVAVAVKEVVLIGYGSGAWLDDDWRPRFYRSDEIFYPDGVGQVPNAVQVCVIKWSYLIHDFWAIIKDKEAAEAAGYHYDNCITAINEAKIDTISRNSAEDDRRRVDAQRDFNTGSTYEKGSKSVDVYIVIATEIDGTCSQWIVRQEDGALIRKVDSLYDSMADVIGMITMSPGSSGGYYNSIGIGRMILNVAYALERTRCFALDQLTLSGLAVLTTEGKSLNNVQLRVMRPFIFVGDEKATVQKAEITFDHAAFVAMNTMLQELIQEIAGVYIPQTRQMNGDRITATEASINANREDAVKRGVVNRIWQHMGDIIATMQRKIYSVDNVKEARRQFDKYQKDVREQLSIEEGGITGNLVFFKKKVFDFIQTTADKLGVYQEPDTAGLADPEAVEVIVNMLAEGMSEKEILILAHSPTSETSQDVIRAQEEAGMAWLQANLDDPMINRHEAIKIIAAKVLGEEGANRVILSQDGQAEEDAGQWRQQAIELATMMENQEVPVVMSDNHAIHQRMIQEKFGEMGESWPIEATGPEFVNALKMVFNHHHDHTQFRLMLGEKEADMPEAVEFDKQAVSIIEALDMRLAQIGAIEQDIPAGFPPGTVTPDMIVGEEEMIVEPPIIEEEAGFQIPPQAPIV